MEHLKLLSNMDLVDKMYNDSVASANSAMNENAIYMKSLQARINQTKASFEQLAIAVGDAFLTESFIQFLNGMSAIANKGAEVSEKYGVLPIIFGTVASAVFLLNKNVRLATTNLTLANTVAKLSSISFKTLGATVKATALTMLKFTGGFIAIGFVIEKVIGAITKARQASEEFEAQQKQLTLEYSSNRESLQKLTKQYELYSEKINSGNYGIRDLQEFNRIRNEIGKQMPSLIQAEDSYGNAILGTSESVKQQIGLLEQRLVLEEKRKASEEQENVENNYNTTKKRLERIRDDVAFTYDEMDLAQAQIDFQIAAMDKMKNTLSNDKNFSSSLKSVVSDFTTYVATTETSVDKIDSLFSGLTKKLETDDSFSKMFRELEISIGDYNKRVSEGLSGKELEPYQNRVSEANQVIKESFTSLLSEAGIMPEVATEIMGKFDASVLSTMKLKESLQLLSNTTGQSVEELMALLNLTVDLSDITLETAGSVDELTTSIEKLAGISQSTIDSLNESVHLYKLLSERTNLTATETDILNNAIKNLTNAYPHLTDGKYVNIKAIEDEINANSTLLESLELAMKGKLDSENSQTLSSALGTKARIENIKKEILALEKLMKANQLVAENSSQFSEDFVLQNETQYIESRKRIGQLSSELDGLQSTLEQNLKKLNTAISPSSSSKSSSSSSKSPTVDKEEFSNMYDEFNRRIKQLQEHADNVRKSVYGESNTSNEYQNALKSEQSLLKQKYSLLDNEYKYIQNLLKLNTHSAEKRIFLEDKLQSLYEQRYDTLVNIDNLTLEITNSALDTITEKVEKLDYALQISQKTQSLYVKDSKEYNAELVKQADLYSKKAIELDKYNSVLKSALANEKLTIVQQKEFSKQIEKTTLELLDLKNAVNSLYTELADSIKNSVIDSYTTAMENAVQSLEKQIEQIETSYDSLIEYQRERLDLLDEEIEKEDRLKAIRELDEEIASVKADKRFSYITSDGKEILTHDKARLSELEKQRGELLQQYQREDIKKAIQDEIKRLEQAKKDKISILNDEIKKTKEHYTQLIKVEKERWEGLTKAAFDGTTSLEETLTTWYGQNLEGLGTHVSEVESMISQLKALYESMSTLTPPSVGGIGGGISGSSSSNPLGMSSEDYSQYVSNKESWAAGINREQVNAANEALRDKYGIKGDALSYNDLKKYHDGGIVEGGKPSRLTELANKLFNTKPNEQVVKMLNNELAVPERNIPNLFTNIQNLVSSIIPKQITAPNMGTVVENNFNGITVYADNAQEFLSSIKHITRTQ